MSPEHCQILLRNRVYWIVAVGQVLVAVIAFSSILSAYRDSKRDVCSRRGCIAIDSLPVSLEGGHCYALQRSFVPGRFGRAEFRTSEAVILIRGQDNIDLCYNGYRIESSLEMHVLWIHNSTNIRVHHPVHFAPEFAIFASSHTFHGIHIGTISDDETPLVPDSSGILLYAPEIYDFADPIVVHNSEVVAYNTTIRGGGIAGPMFSCLIGKSEWSLYPPYMQKTGRSIKDACVAAMQKS